MILPPLHFFVHDPDGHPHVPLKQIKCRHEAIVSYVYQLLTSIYIHMHLLFLKIIK
jgi:hypothetical protein